MSMQETVRSKEMGATRVQMALCIVLCKFVSLPRANAERDADEEDEEDEEAEDDYGGDGGAGEAAGNDEVGCVRQLGGS